MLSLILWAVLVVLLVVAVVLVTIALFQASVIGVIFGAYKISQLIDKWKNPSNIKW